MQRRKLASAVFVLSIFALGQDPVVNVASQSSQDRNQAARQTTRQVPAGRKNQHTRSGETTRPEEVLIRDTYAKMSYADEVRIVLDAVLRTPREELWKANANLADLALNSRLRFELSNFHFGKLNAIADRKIAEFDGMPSAIGGEVLDVTPSIYNYRANNSPSKYVAYVKFAWKPSRYLAVPPQENWPVAKALQLEEFEGKRYTDYVTYTVALTLGSTSRTYNAWMLFGPDEKGKEQVYFMDSVADGTAVLFAFEHSLYPAAFAETDLRTVPFIDKWLYDNALSCKAMHSEKDDRVDVCCDPEIGRCGVAQSTLSPYSTRRIIPSRNPAHLLPASFRFSPVLLHPLVQSAPAGCAKFNVSTTFPHGLSDVQEHNTGQHTFVATVLGSCTYTDGPTIPGPCNVQCSAQSSSAITDAGSLSGLVFEHATAKTDSSGGDFSNGGSTAISCLGISGGTVRSCFFSCSTSVNATAGGKGNLGASINFPANALWNDQNQGQVMCQPQTTATISSDGGGGGLPPNPCLNGSTASPSGSGAFTSPTCSPIIVDTRGEGFPMTSAAAGVMFDITGTGNPVQLAWTAWGSHDAFLALPGPDGLVHNGKELFGNFTPQPQSEHPNGFLALAQFDKPENGGNGDGVIDERDAVFSRLRLWIDENHDGSCQSSELHTLPELGVFSLALKYSESRRTDDFGNQFRYRARVNPDPNDGEPEVGRWTYDVFLAATNK